MVTTTAEIYLEGAGGGTVIEAEIQWDYIPAYSGSRIDPPYGEGVECAGVTKIRMINETDWHKPEPFLEALIADCIDDEWLLEQGDHLADFDDPRDWAEE